uniref:Uncharacterized protein n=1 Tax=Strongyloides stercoralis TaxID=6248 RepID=A0AAF5DKP1_STRER
EKVEGERDQKGEGRKKKGGKKEKEKKKGKRGAQKRRRKKETRRRKGKKKHEKEEGKFLPETNDYKPTIYFFWHTLLNWHHLLILSMLNMPRMYVHTHKKAFFNVYLKLFFNLGTN